MFSLFSGNPEKKLKTKRNKLLEEAMNIQRSGDLKLYATKMQEVEEIEKKLKELKGS
jgi:hypothetical protein